MSRTRRFARVRSRSVSVLAAVGVIAAGLAATLPADASTAGFSGSAATTKFESGRYIVLMDGAPTAAYRGGERGFAATAPTGSRTFDSDSREARRYASHLRTRQEAAADAVGARPYYHYTASLNGFAAELSAGQARALSRRADVSAVVEDEIRQLDTVTSSNFLGLTGPLGLWRRIGGSSSKDGAGRNVVVGIVDSGINSDSASFASTGTPAPPGFSGDCDEGHPQDNGGFSCNDKIIAADYYNAGLGGDDAIWDGDYLSPEDYGGHGSHTASTAAGNSGVNMDTEGYTFGNGSGMAPAARIAAYKVCWQFDPTQSGCATSDSVAAIDQAVKDGVDVINYSISGAVASSLDLVEIAFMYAADAGVFVAASAGNAGPTASTVAHPSPWLTTVAAAAHTVNESTLVLGNGERYVGASLTGGIGDTPMVLADEAVLAGQDRDEALLCMPDTLDPSVVAGKIVVCDRGVIARADKSRAVEDAGGAAMVLVNTSPNSLNSDLHVIPSIHLSETDRPDVRDYVRTAQNPVGAILARDNEGSTTPPPPTIASFSSRGPSLASEGDVLKPDIAAPGADVLAAVAPEGNHGRDFDFYSGTSMSSPHIAGLAALIIQKHPRWSPMVVKSAMMTTARDLNDTRSPFDQGAGFVVPKSFMDPGLAFDSDFDDWEDFLSGQCPECGFTDNPSAASNFNSASVAVSGMLGIESVTREVTNVDDQASTYTFSRNGLRGIKVEASPSTFTLRPGASRVVTLTFTRRTAAQDRYATGYLFFKDSRGHSVRFPAVVNPSGIEAPAEVFSDAGTFRIRTTSGITGTIAAARGGLVRARDKDGVAENTHYADFDPQDDRNVKRSFAIGGRSEYLRVQVKGNFAVNDDMDLFLTDADGNVVAMSASYESDEEVSVTGLRPGTYTAHIQAWRIADDAPSKQVTLRAFHVKGGPQDNWTVAPGRQAVRMAQSQRWTVTTGSLRPSVPYMGVIDWREVRRGSAPNPVLGRTLVSIQP